MRNKIVIALLVSLCFLFILNMFVFGNTPNHENTSREHVRPDIDITEDGNISEVPSTENMQEFMIYCKENRQKCEEYCINSEEELCLKMNERGGRR